MNESAILYYDKNNGLFSLTPSDNTIEAFKAHTKEGWKDGVDEIKLGDFKIVFHTNFYPKAPKREYIYVDIYVKEILLLPLSIACRKAAVLYHFSERQIAFVQCGTFKNTTPHTFVQREDSISWLKTFERICEICNNYRHWMLQETNLLISNLEAHSRTKFWDVAYFIDITRRYEIIIPEIVPAIIKFVDKLCFESMEALIDNLKGRNIVDSDKRLKAFCGDMIWRYIRDYKLS